MGQNGRWRTALVQQIVEGSTALSRDPVVLDVATGTAGVAVEIARRCQAKVVGIDITEEMLLAGRRRVEDAGLAERIELVMGKAESLPFPDASFDALSFTYLLRYVEDPAATLEELARVVRPGATVASLEFLAPPNPFWRLWWWLYTRILLPTGGLLTGGTPWAKVGRFLGPSISEHYRRYPVAWTVEAWHKAGFEGVEARAMSLGGGLVMWGRRRGP